MQNLGGKQSVLWAIGKKSIHDSYVTKGVLNTYTVNVSRRYSVIYRGYYTVARRYEFYVLVARTISHE